MERDPNRYTTVTADSSPALVVPVLAGAPGAPKRLTWLVEIDSPLAVIPGHVVKHAAPPHVPVCVVPKGGSEIGMQRQRAIAYMITASPDMLAMLKELEWAGADHDHDGVAYECCPVCEAQKDLAGHHQDCRLASLLQAASPELADPEPLQTGHAPKRRRRRATATVKTITARPRKSKPGVVRPGPHLVMGSGSYRVDYSKRRRRSRKKSS